MNKQDIALVAWAGLLLKAQATGEYRDASRLAAAYPERSSFGMNLALAKDKATKAERLMDLALELSKET